MSNHSLRVALAICAIVAVGTIGEFAPQASAAVCQTFPQTGKAVCDPFLTYWHANGGLARQGLPLTDAFVEVSPTDGKPYMVQYFERARFEHHPENAGTDYEVLLGLLGSEQFEARYPGMYPGNTPGPQLVGPGAICFEQGGICILPQFYRYWQEHGGLAQFGLPLTFGFNETNPTDGQQYHTVYFERARFEYHEEFAGTEAAVQLGLLGREQLALRYPGGQPVAASPLHLDPPQVDFSTRGTGSSTEIVVNVRNDGPVPIGFADAQILGPDAGAFSVRARSCMGAIPPPGGGCAIGVYFTPMHPGDYQAMLVLVPTVGEPATLPLYGQAQPGP